MKISHNDYDRFKRKFYVYNNDESSKNKNLLQHEPRFYIFTKILSFLTSRFKGISINVQCI